MRVLFLGALLVLGACTTEKDTAFCDSVCEGATTASARVVVGGIECTCYFKTSDLSLNTL